MVKALKQAGSTVIIFKQRADGSLSSGGHLIWSEIGAKKEMLEWLFSQKRSEHGDANESHKAPSLNENETPFIPALGENELPPVGGDIFG